MKNFGQMMQKVQEMQEKNAEYAGANGRLRN